MKLIIEVDHANVFLIRYSLENELNRLKGRAEMNKNDYGIIPDQYTLGDIARLEKVIRDIANAKAKFVDFDEEHLNNTSTESQQVVDDMPF
jgi:hypothetical protein